MRIEDNQISFWDLLTFLQFWILYLHSDFFFHLLYSKITVVWNTVFVKTKTALPLTILCGAFDSIFKIIAKTKLNLFIRYLWLHVIFNDSHILAIMTIFFLEPGPSKLSGPVLLDQHRTLLGPLVHYWDGTRGGGFKPCCKHFNYWI